MDVDDDDDFYGAEDAGKDISETQPKAEQASESTAKSINKEEDLEEGEEEDDDEEEESDSDVDIITERKDGDTPTQSIYNKAPPLRNAPPDEPVKPSVKKEAPVKEPPKIDVDAKPIYEPAGKPITQVNIDEDLPENDKPWRKPGTDISDYFNYGFDEFTWALYASKQETIKSESQTNKKMFDDMSMMFGMGGMGGMSGMPAATDGIPAEMQQMMQQMMASGMDPSQMDPSMFGAAGTVGAQVGNPVQGFGGQQAFGQGQNAYGGYDQQQQQGMDGNNRRGNFRGRGGRRGGW